MEQLRAGVKDELVKHPEWEGDEQSRSQSQPQAQQQNAAASSSTNGALTTTTTATPTTDASAAADGIVDAEGLGWPAKSTKLRLHHTPEESEANLLVLSQALRTVLQCIGEDPDREGLQRTPERYAKALMWMTKGYEDRLVNVINDAVFAEDHDEMVIVRDIDVFSLCEHHLVPFHGKVCAFAFMDSVELGRVTRAADSGSNMSA